MRRPAFLFPLLLVAPLAAPPEARPAAAPAPEVRALWVDAFGAGIRTPEEAEELVLEAKRANLNLLFVQVRRRADVLYGRGFEPPLDDPAYDPGFDALENVLRVARREGLAVHAWVNAMPVWPNTAPPCDARHLYHRHGPSAAGEARWLTASPDGGTTFPVGAFLDPGHPAVQEYLASVYADLVREYDLDGLHFDYIRYPETEAALPRGAAVGYNAAALARFRRSSGRTGTPTPADEAWTAWRRLQVSHVVRRVSLEAKSIRPGIVVSAAVIPWGAPPADGPSFADAVPMQRVFQDWQVWLREGFLDLAVPMNYVREADERARGWFDGWIAFESRHQHDRKIAVGLGAYRNSPDETLAQIRRVRNVGDPPLAGVSVFSYAVPRPRPDPATGVPLPPPGERLTFLAYGTPDAPGAFPEPAPLPAFPWIERPTLGAIAGVLSAASREEADEVVVEVRRTGLLHRTHRVLTDANGFFGLANLEPGTWRVRLPGAATARAEVYVEVGPGLVSRADLDAR